jgi:glycosyltransferase involved in cell wall biosynthesis
LKTVLCFADLEKFFHTPADRNRWTRGELGARDGRCLLGTVGEVVPRKGHRYLFGALPEIVRALPDARLMLLGRFHRDDREARWLRRFQLREKLFRRVHWLGRRDNVQDYMAAMDICVVPSVEEPLGLVAVEAQAAGVPVIATRVGGLPEIVADGETGLLVPPRDPAAIAHAVLRLRNDPELRSRLVAAGRESARAKFDPELLTEEVIRAYRELLGR